MERSPRLRSERLTGASAAALSLVIGAFMGTALFSTAALFVVPLAPIGGYLGIRALHGASAARRGVAWAGIVLNAAVIALFVFIALRYYSLQP